MTRLFESDRIRLRAWGCMHTGCGVASLLVLIASLGGLAASVLPDAQAGHGGAIVGLVFVAMLTAMFVGPVFQRAPASLTSAAAAFLKHPVPATPLTPSERVMLPSLLQPLPPATWGGTLAAATADARFADPEEDPRPRAHANVALAVALLANEAMGALRFELGTRVTRVWFRRRTVPVLWVHAAGVAPSWPAGSWEARLWAVAARRARRRTPDADTLFRAAIPSDTRPEVSAVTALCIPLCARGVLTIAREPWALQWRADQGKPVLALTPGGATRLDEAPDPALATLAERCARERPAVWAALSAAVARSFDANVVSYGVGGGRAGEIIGPSWTDAAGRVHDRWTLQADVAEIVGAAPPTGASAAR